MGDAVNCPNRDEKINKEAPQLVNLLKEMKEGLDTVRSKVEALTAKIKADKFPTADGINYLEAKHLLLLNYCQSLVYYLLRKAKGLSIEGHPVVRSLIGIRLFLEKIRPIDKKMEYQIQKLTRVTANVAEKVNLNEKGAVDSQKSEDLLKYRPNPDMVVIKTDMSSQDGIYRPPKFAPKSMEEDYYDARKERNALRKEEEMFRKAQQSDYIREWVNDLEGKPEEARETVGTESREVKRHLAKWEERAQQEEDLFIRAPLTKAEKKKMKHLQKSRNGLLGLTEDFYDEIKTLPLGDSIGEQTAGFNHGGTGERKHKKRKRMH